MDDILLVSFLSVWFSTSRLDEEQKSLEFQHLTDIKNSCFDHFESKQTEEENSLLHSRKKFTLEGW